MENYNWKEFVKRITINAAQEKIYKAWATQAGLESWFLRSAEFTSTRGRRVRHEEIQKGDKYKWLWFGYDDAVKEENEILDANANRLQFGFSGGCIVTVSILQEHGVNICELHQEMTMDDEESQRYFFIECGKGWTFYMTNLKSIMEGGLDLRNKIESVKNVINS